MVISEAGNDPKVAGLVYVAAIVPDEGQAASDVLKPYAPGPGLGEAKPDASGFLALTRKGIDEDFVPEWGFPHIPPVAMIRKHKQPISGPFLLNSVSIVLRSLGMTLAQRLHMPMPPVTPIKPTGWW